MKEAPNFAKDQTFATEISSSLGQTLQQIRSNRTAREQKWMEYYQLWRVDDENADDGRLYEGRANLNLPQVRKEIETMSRRILKGLFPEDYLKADPSRIENEELANVNAQIVRHFYDNVMNLKNTLAPWIKQGVTYGSSPARQFWKKEVNKQFFKKREFVEKDGILVPKRRTVFEEVVAYDAPVVQACDLFRTWVHPETAPSPRDIEIQFFETCVTEDVLREKVAQGCAFLPKGWEEQYGKTKKTEDQKTEERLATFGSSGEADAAPGTKYFWIIEAWTTLYIDVKHEGKAIKQKVPCVIEWISGGPDGYGQPLYCYRIQQNPLWHQVPPYVWMRYISPLPGNFYGHGLPEAVISLQNQLNDTLNQSMDASTMALNPITIVNPAFAPNVDSFEIEPRAIWWADPNAVKSFTFPDLSQSGIQSANVLRNMISEMSDNTPQLPDPIAGKARSTGQAELAIGEWRTDLFNFIDSIIQEALEPMAQQTHFLLQQNLPDDAVYKIAGKYAGKWINRVVTPDDIAGRYYFKWIGRYGIESDSVKTQQMLNLLKIVASIPPEAGIKIKWDNYLIKLMRDGFQIKDVENVIETSFLDSSTDPYTENKILALGGDVMVHESDEDDLHIDWHKKLLNETKDVYVRAITLRHIAKHEEQKRKKALEAQMKQMAEAAMLAQAGGGGAMGGPQGGGAPQGNRNNPMGNQAQITEATSPDDMRRGMRG